MIRQIQADDWPHIVNIERLSYPNSINESLESMQSKWQLAPSSCFVAVINHAIAGYILAHPWKINVIPHCNSQCKALPQTDCLYLHDMAIDPQYRGQGIAQQLLKQLKNMPHPSSIRTLALVALPDAHQFWLKQGFSPSLANSAQLRQALATYPEQTQYMLCPLRG